MTHQELHDESALSIVVSFAFSICLTMFAGLRLPSITAIVGDIAHNSSDGQAAAAFYDLSMTSLAWDMLLGVAVVFWVAKLFRSPVSQVFASILGASIGAWIALHR